MTQEDRDYFKSGVRTLCGIEVIQAKNIINDPGLKVVFTSEDLDFMNKELGRQAGAVFARILRAIKKKDFKEAQRVITGGKKQMKTIAIINMKGGCAKTTTSVNMGYILAEDYDKKVLIIDNDKQGNLSKACGVWNDEAPSFADVLTGDKTLTDVMQLGANGNIAVVPANMTLLTANLEVIKNEEIDQVTILSKELEKVKDVFDYCIIDCPPDINISVINALVAADEVIIPIKIDGYAFDGMKELEEQINNAKQLNPKLKFRGCLVTMFYNRDVCRQGEEYLQNQRYPVFRTHIRRTEKADEVTFTTQSLMQYSPRSGAARDYKTFVKEYLEG